MLGKLISFQFWGHCRITNIPSELKSSPEAILTVDFRPCHSEVSQTSFGCEPVVRWKLAGEVCIFYHLLFFFLNNVCVKIENPDIPRPQIIWVICESSPPKKNGSPGPWFAENLCRLGVLCVPWVEMNLRDPTLEEQLQFGLFGLSFQVVQRHELEATAQDLRHSLWCRSRHSQFGHQITLKCVHSQYHPEAISSNSILVSSNISNHTRNKKSAINHQLSLIFTHIYSHTSKYYRSMVKKIKVDGWKNRYYQTTNPEKPETYYQLIVNYH